MSLFNSILLVGSLLVAALLSGMEAGIFAMNPVRIRQLARSGDRRAAVLGRFLDRPENFIWTILVGSTVSNFTGIGLIVLGLHTWLFENTWLFLSLLVVSVFLFYLAVDLVPKIVFRQFPHRFCLFLARPFQIIHWGLRPIVSLMEGLARTLLRWTQGNTFKGRLFASRDELKFLVLQDSSQALTPEEKQMINRVMELQNSRVADVMIPRQKLVSVATTSSSEEILSVAREHLFSFFPVLDPATQNFVGLLSLNDLLFSAEPSPGMRAEKLMQPPLILDAHTRLDEALRTMTRAGQRTALVRTSAPDKVEAIVTWRDILKTIFGELKL